MAPRLSSLRRVRWLLLFELARMTHGHIMEVTSPADRRRVMEIVKASKGDPRKISARDRDDLKRIAGQLHLGQLAMGLGPSLLGRGKRR